MSKNNNFKIDLKGAKYSVLLCDLIGNNSNIYGRTHTGDIDEKLILIKNDCEDNSLRKVVLHELLHAVSYECGFTDFFDNEYAIEFVAQIFDYIYDKANYICAKLGIEQPKTKPKGRKQ